MTKLRVVALIDVDCFYAQAEQLSDPALRNAPVAVFQPRNSSLIAISYEARKYGVARFDSMREARAKCAEIIFRANRMEYYREQSDALFQCMMTIVEEFGGVFQRASVDEAYLDLTPESLDNIDMTDCDAGLVEGAAFQDSPDEETVLLHHASMIMKKIQQTLRSDLGYSTSVGIACSKVMSKIAAGLKKPGGFTVLSKSQFSSVLAEKVQEIQKIPFFGGKLGDTLAERGLKSIAEAQSLSEEQLCNRYCDGDMGLARFILDRVRGIDDTLVVAHHAQKSIMIEKSYNAMTTIALVESSTGPLVEQLMARLEKEKRERHRIAKQLTARWRFLVRNESTGGRDITAMSKTMKCDLERFISHPADIVTIVMKMFRDLVASHSSLAQFKVNRIGVLASQFEEIAAVSEGAHAQEDILRMLTRPTDQLSEVAGVTETDPQVESDRKLAEALAREERELFLASTSNGSGTKRPLDKGSSSSSSTPSSKKTRTIQSFFSKKQ